jgi:uncharacterized protein YdbL (DUF1318 family)
MLRLLPLLLLTGCKTLPAIPLTTPEPLKVDLTMRLDVYQYRGEEPGNKEEIRTVGEAVERQRNRMAEIQELKNNRIVGEDHRGLLSLRQTPAGKWGDHVKRTVEEENTDRTLLMRNEAKESNRPLNEIEIEAWKLRTDQAFKGEYIEVAGKTPGAFDWVQATGPKETKDTPPDKINPTPPPPQEPQPKP